MQNPEIATDVAESVVNWSPDSPRGGRTVLNRILKENAAVPLFFAQTLIASLRDVGYNHTTSAICEHVDNAIEAGATEVRIYYRQLGKKGDYTIDAAVYDNGRGMEPNVLKVATSFGGSMNYNDRNGIGRFGMGMKTAALSMSPVMELYSWQETGAIYSMMLDVEAVGKDRSNAVYVPDPTLNTELPGELAEIFSTPMVWPSNRNEQELLADDAGDLAEHLGPRGTIVYMPSCDRLSSRTARTLSEHAVAEMSRIYRRAISSGLRLFVNNRRVEAFDPTYSMPNARHARMVEGVPALSRLVLARPVDIPISEKDPSRTAQALVKIFRLPIEEWSDLERKVQRNDLRIFDGLTVSILRNDREVFAGGLPKLTTRHSVTNWYRVQIDFPGVLDEAFGVASNKQGVRMKDYVLDAIRDEVGGDITKLNDEIKRFQGEKASRMDPAKASASERRANEVDYLHTKPVDTELTDEEQAQLNANLMGLAVTLRRDGETDEQAFERVKSSKYLIAFRHDEYWPFYHIDHKFGRIILTINTAHPFFEKLYNPLRDLATKPAGEDETVPGTEPMHIDEGPLVALELLLLSLARAQGVLGRDEDAKRVFDQMRKEWSETYRIQLVG
ncbi:ATP-binding protein [Paraburkholderia sp. UCT31]|uniref:ATP-binding protein n=1 Tax=Paraburkholderia sp. UCT31 TaxID=2615209 RepID=UPI00223A8944|nr:ATP-binding protein [Paraburkholderia sp. UCT31]